MEKTRLKIGCFVFTKDSVSSGIVKRIGINIIEVDNNVNINKVKFGDIDEVI